MKTSVMVLACLLLLQLLATTAHGIRLDRQLHEALSSSKKELAGDSKAGAPPDAVDHSSSRRCTPDGNCSGMEKKPVAPQSAPGEAKHQVQAPLKVMNGAVQSGQRSEVATTSQSHAGGKGAAAGTWSRQAKQQKTRTRTYPDILDIAGMDYSPAARKPPIHN
uniref:Uncharacterized protein n=1 Tax=Avena sativa TaxID=4498 RepID=A0ACD5UGD0_AVESA